MKKNINDDLSGGDYSMDNAADARNKKNIQWCNYDDNDATDTNSDFTTPML